MAANRTNLELKLDDDQEVSQEKQAANRTNLELKQRCWASGFFINKTANRTNLELKQFFFKFLELLHWLPIGPIWNWNTLGRLLGFSTTSANRTNLELKHFAYIAESVGNNTANRTNLELKPCLWSRWSIPSNLPIGPIWNWNSNSSRFLPPR